MKREPMAYWWPQGVIASSREDAARKIIAYLEDDLSGELARRNETFGIECECHDDEKYDCPCEE